MFGRQLLAFALVCIVLTVASALAYVFAEPANAKNLASFVLEEVFEAALTLTLVTCGGVALKIAADSLLEDQLARRAAAQQHANRRNAIIREYVNTFSNFYSVRKLYDSAPEPHESCRT